MVNDAARATILLAALCVLGGCADAKSYGMNRLADFMDIFDAELTPAIGLEAHTEVTGFLGTAAGYSGYPRRGWILHGREMGYGSRRTHGYLLQGSTRLRLHRSRIVYGTTTKGGKSHLWTLFVRGYPPYVLLDVPPWYEALDVAIGATPLFASLHLGLSPGEAFDFIAGLGTFDPVGDDYHPGERPPQAPSRSKPAALE